MLYEKARQFWRMCMSDTDTRIVLVTNEFAVVTKRIGEVRKRLRTLGCRCSETVS